MTYEEIKQKRIDLGLSQQKFAEKLGVTVRTISRWERGVSRPSPLAIMGIKRILENGGGQA